MTRSMKLQPDDGPRYSLGIGPSSDHTVGSRRKFARRFAEGIGKLARNTKGDHRKEDRRTCHKITGGCRSMRDELPIPQNLGDGQLLTTRFDLHPKKIGSGCRCLKKEDSEVDVGRWR
ncbi:hypothetical protein GW17_00018943 [Ensete ventricosum]|nr:hypothetical protein GW17_00018943 [Ensete ventricosum]